jgi:hypothetical protein
MLTAEQIACVPPGVEPVETAPPSSLSTVLARRPVAFAARLTRSPTATRRLRDWA